MDEPYTVRQAIAPRIPIEYAREPRTRVWVVVLGVVIVVEAVGLGVLLAVAL